MNDNKVNEKKLNEFLSRHDQFKVVKRSVQKSPEDSGSRMWIKYGNRNLFVCSENPESVEYLKGFMAKGGTK